MYMICKFWPKIPLSWTECPVSRVLPSLWSLYLSPLTQIIHNGALNWLCFGKKIWELQDFCPVPERTAWQWCLNLFVSELTHSALYTLINRWRKNAYTRVFVCIYIYTVTDVDTWMLRWLSWAVFLCEYLYTVEQINKKNEAKVSFVQSLNCLWIIRYALIDLAQPISAARPNSTLSQPGVIQWR